MHVPVPVLSSCLIIIACVPFIQLQEAATYYRQMGLFAWLSIDICIVVCGVAMMSVIRSLCIIEEPHRSKQCHMTHHDLSVTAVGLAAVECRAHSCMCVNFQYFTWSHHRTTQPSNDSVNIIIIPLKLLVRYESPTQRIKTVHTGVQYTINRKQHGSAYQWRCIALELNVVSRLLAGRFFS